MLSLLLGGFAASLLLSLLVFVRASRNAWESQCWSLTEASACLTMALGAIFLVARPDTTPLAGTYLRWDLLTATMLLLVGFLGWVITRFSRQYLSGDPATAHYLRWLSAVLACVALLVASNHLALMALAWTATSLSLHRLLTLYDHRRAARLAAHKKFLLARVADLAMFGALVLVYQNLNTLHMDRLGEVLANASALPPQLHGAACLVAFSAIVKCGQLPFHGWLIQVMEAPTPVSALLHAGVINIGGFVLIRLAALLSLSEPAQVLLIAFGGFTVVVASLVMMTRSSIKVYLAWSTCAQMGFMLLECGLGAYSLALLHLVAHSLYKAYRFLSAGETVWLFRQRELGPRLSPPSVRHWLVGGGLSLGLGVLGLSLNTATPLLVFAWGMGMMPLWARATRDLRLLGAGLWVAGLYFVQHEAFTAVLELPPAPDYSSGIALAGLFLVCLGFLSVSIQLAPTGLVSRWLYPRALVGFNLDERFTQFTQMLWPAPLPAQSQPYGSLRSLPALEI